MIHHITPPWCIHAIKKQAKSPEVTREGGWCWERMLILSGRLHFLADTLFRTIFRPVTPCKDPDHQESPSFSPNQTRLLGTPVRPHGCDAGVLEEDSRPVTVGVGGEAGRARSRYRIRYRIQLKRRKNPVNYMKSSLCLPSRI